MNATPVFPGDLLRPGAIALGVSAASKRHALAVAAELAGRAFDLKAHRVLEALLAREAQSSTGVGHGVAIPHAHIPGLTGLRGVFVRLRPPVAFEAIDEEPVDLMFALIAPPEAAPELLRGLARVARSLRAAELRRGLRQAATPDSVRALLTLEARPTAA